MEIEEIIDAILKNRIRISDHADEEAESDELAFDEVFFSVLHGEIIEDYPVDRPYPGCLVYGMTFSGDPVHSACAYRKENQWAVLVTVYRPDPSRWVNWRERKRNDAI